MLNVYGETCEYKKYYENYTLNDSEHPLKHDNDEPGTSYMHWDGNR